MCTAAHASQQPFRPMREFLEFMTILVKIYSVTALGRCPASVPKDRDPFHKIGSTVCTIGGALAIWREQDDRAQRYSAGLSGR
jgi:hypothetical protein